MPIRITGLNSGLDTEAIISALVSSYSYKTQKYEKAQTKLSWKQDAWKELNTKIYSLYTSVGNLRFTSAYNLKSASSSDATKLSVTAGSNAANGSYSVQVTSLAKAGYLTGSKLNNITKADGTTEKVKGSTKLEELGYTGADGKLSLTVGGKTKEISVTKDTTVQQVVNQLKENGVNANFDEANGRFFISAKGTGIEKDFTLTSSDPSIMTALGLDEENGARRIDASDAKIYVNGAEFTSDNNTFAINGMTFTATGVTITEDEMQAALANGTEDVGAVNVTVNTDTQGIYDKVKDFLTQYNSLINEMTKLYNAASSKGYEPLTDEEKDALSDTEVEKWETKIKDSILRRDDTLSGIINTMTSAMSKGVTVNGKTLYLSNFGIKTLGYLNAPENEQNAYHIDGDEDDTNTSGNVDKLMSAIAENPDEVIDFMKGLATNLYESVDKKMKATTLSTSYTVYNDKEMASEYSDYTSTIRKWQERLEQQEEYYYKKFAAMEKALSKINSQSSAFGGLFG